ncbi:hypothetical protein [Rhodoflexus sp.]
MNYRLITLALMCTFAAACTHTANDNQENQIVSVPTEEADPWEAATATEEDEFPDLPLKELLSALKDSVDRTWYLSVKSDEKKLSKILQLTTRIEKYPQHSKSAVDSVRMLHKWLTTNTLTWETLADTEKTLAYDNNFEQMMQLIRTLRETPGSESCTACIELYDEISASYDDDLILRRRYDRFAMLLNKIIDKKQDSIRLLPPPLNQVSRKPLFMPQTTSL